MDEKRSSRRSSKRSSKSRSSTSRRSTMLAEQIGEEGALMVFVHGWPDDPSVWDKQVAEFKETNRCLMITLPMFGKNVTKADKTSWGFNFDELAEMLADRTREAMRDEDDKAILVVHDWGAGIGFFAQDRFPELYKAVIAMDIGPMVYDEPTAEKFAGLLFEGVLYQYALLLFFVLSRLAPDWFRGAGRRVGQAVSYVFKQPNTNFPRLEDAHVDNTYLYWYYHANFWREYFGVGRRKFKRALRPSEPPAVPTLFFWGENKPTQFFEPEFLTNLEARDDCDVVATKTGHWMMDEAPELVNARMKSFLEENDLV